MSATGAEFRTILGLYVDDGLPCCSDFTIFVDLVKKLDNEFEVTVADGSYFVMLEIHRNRSKSTIAISQRNYMEEILDKFNMQSCKPVASPGDLSMKLSKDMAPSTVYERNCFV
ncbi:Retrovirus-related Pol polyprotein from transposon TNT 1-94 [Trichinella zimbabwensis]|uniref:Retrovirus-related Pol polyprotein from transposon TNT 1-94 n=1 Tax=Trichinella zimbabwensis TaxID=268475 RepID=A0A0V1I3L3_9BILA|nr:Retrovirus-related Pol polyprotein from transposon TNT 1-94 [Trichinella zimbabwensis]